MNAQSFNTNEESRCLWRIRDRAGARWNPHRRWRTLWWQMTEMQAQVWAAKHGFEIERVERPARRAA